MARFVVIGAGLAGISLAGRLTHVGHDCSIFEKNQELGGRLATKQFDNWCVDYGTQYFTARSEQFRSQVANWVSKGWVTSWDTVPWVLDRNSFDPSPDQQTRYVGLPSMNQMVSEEAKALDTYLDTRIDRLEQVGRQWRLWDGYGEHYGLFDAVLLTAPLAQSMALLPKGTKAEVALRSATMSPTWVHAIALVKPTGISADALFSRNGILSWAAKNSAKPGRQSSYETWVMHFAPQWTANHLDVSEELLEYQTVKLLELLSGHEIGPIHGSFSYRWLYARASAKEVFIPQWDEELCIGLAGDWTLGSRLEDAWLSASAVFDKLQHQFA